MSRFVEYLLKDNLTHEELVTALRVEIFATEPWRWGCMSHSEIDELPVDTVAYLIRDFKDAMTKREVA